MQCTARLNRKARGKDHRSHPGKAKTTSTVLGDSQIYVYINIIYILYIYIYIIFILPYTYIYIFVYLFIISYCTESDFSMCLYPSRNLYRWWCQSPLPRRRGRLHMCKTNAACVFAGSLAGERSHPKYYELSFHHSIIIIIGNQNIG